MYWKRKDVNGAIRYKLYAPAAMDADDLKTLMHANTNNGKVQERLWQMFYNMDAIQQEWVWLPLVIKIRLVWRCLAPSQNGHARQRPLQEQVDEYEYISLTDMATLFMIAELK